MKLETNNKHIKEFFKKHSKNDQTRLMKYLALFGIYYLEQNNKIESSFEQLKAMAKEISKNNLNKNQPDMKNEIISIKNELFKLNQKIEQKQNQSTLLLNQQINKGNDQLVKHISNNSSTNEKTSYSNLKPPKQESARPTVQAKNLTSKPPTDWREGDKTIFDRKKSLNENSSDNRSEHGENGVYPTWWEWDKNQKLIKEDRNITAKITESDPPHIENASSKKNIITRHHLDDKETKKILGESNGVFIQKDEQKQRIDIEKKRFKDIESDKENIQNPKFNSFFQEKKAKIVSRIASPMNDKNLNAIDESKSTPIPGKKVQYAIGINQQNSNQKSKENKGVIGCFYKPDKGIEKSQKKRGQIKRNISSKTLGDGNHQTNLMKRLECVESKIKNEINYDKEMSKQQKRLRNNGMLEGTNDDFISNSSLRDKFVFVDKEDHSRMTSDRIEKSSRNGVDEKFFQSSYQGQKSLASQYSQYTRTQFQDSSTNRCNRIENLSKNEDINHYKVSSLQHQDKESVSSVLNIANNFLNSPLMYQLSNQDCKNTTELSSKGSICSPSGLKKQPSSDCYFDTKSPSYGNNHNNNRSGSKRFYEDEYRSKRTTTTGCGYPDWITTMEKFENKEKENFSILKDSQNRKHGAELPPKDSRIFEKADDQSSFSDSNFRTFLNEDLKGFFQKEFDIKKLKKSNSMLKSNTNKYSTLSSDNSSNVSFKYNDQNNNIITPNTPPITTGNTNITTNSINDNHNHNTYDLKNDKNPYYYYNMNKGHTNSNAITTISPNSKDTNAIYKNDKMNISRLLTNP